MRRKISINQGLDALLKYLALGTFAFTAYSYFYTQHLTNKRLASDKAQEYINDYTFGKVSSYGDTISSFWRQDELLIIRNAAKLSESDLHRVFLLISRNSKYLDYEKALNRVLLHFDLIALCMTQNLCNGAIISSFYCDEYRLLRPIFEVSFSKYRLEGIIVGKNAREYFNAQCAQPSIRSVGSNDKLNQQ